jgi:hypothetical protein
MKVVVMGKKKKPKFHPLCVYCGKEPGTTVDHVIAECFFDITPPDAVKVPACGKCNNNKKSQMDVYVRDILVLDMRTDRHPVSQLIRQGTLRRSIKKNHSVAFRTAATKGRLIPVRTPSGLYLGHHVEIPIRQQEIQKYFFNIVQGLYYHFRKVYLPATISYECDMISGRDFEILFHQMKSSGANGPYRLGNHVFECLCMIAEEEPHITAWLFWFYDALAFVVHTGHITYER